MPMPSIQLPHDPQRRLNLLSSSRFDLPTVHAMMTDQFTNASLFDTFVFNGQEFIKGHQWAFSLSQLSQSGILIDHDTLNTQAPTLSLRSSRYYCHGLLRNESAIVPKMNSRKSKQKRLRIRMKLVNLNNA